MHSIAEPIGIIVIGVVGRLHKWLEIKHPSANTPNAPAPTVALWTVTEYDGTVRIKMVIPELHRAVGKPSQIFKGDSRCFPHNYNPQETECPRESPKRSHRHHDPDRVQQHAQQEVQHGKSPLSRNERLSFKPVQDNPAFFGFFDTLLL